MSFEVPYDLIGGEETLDKLVNAFYPKVYAHPDLAPLFEGEMAEIMRKQKMFLTQFLGGPALYSMEFGAPAMRARHMPFEITPTRAKAWLACMKEAMDDIELDGPIRKEFYDRLTQVAGIMINTPDNE
ncbi:globin domain-containing protein [Bacillus sp. Marseille-P3661]|uniref:globin domain-containing protein n=1 Tax=Bacillus sp. Marseille-P3661 TaxID=1936234 RepID=UPI000C8278DB|nr:globin [Bacillus sp. Marseille-P3661]